MSLICNLPVRGFRNVSRLHDDLDNLLAVFLGGPDAAEQGQAVEASAFSPCLDLESTDSAYLMKLELPGVESKDIAIKVEDGILAVSGEKKTEKTDAKKHVSERSYGSFSRRLRLPEDADADAVKAKFKDGVLTVTIPKTKPEKPKAKLIAIE